MDGTTSPGDIPSGTNVDGDDASYGTPSTTNSYTEGESMHERRVSHIQGKELESMDLAELLSLCKTYRNRVAESANPQDVVSLQLINEVLARKIEASATFRNRHTITESTPLEPIKEQIESDSEKENIGLTNFKGSMPTRAETEIAKNYLNEKELYTQSKKGNIKIELTKKEEEFSRIVNDIFKEKVSFCWGGGEYMRADVAIGGDKFAV